MKDGTLDRMTEDIATLQGRVFEAQMALASIRNRPEQFATAHRRAEAHREAKDRLLSAQASLAAARAVVGTTAPRQEPVAAVIEPSGGHKVGEWR